MDRLDVGRLQLNVQRSGARWRVRQLPPGQREYSLGWEPSPAVEIGAALSHGDQLATTQQALSGGASTRPRKFDWRDRKVIGPVTDQQTCGSCVSFATAGLVSTMAAIELGVSPPDLSEADQHFCSSHGATCSGWFNHLALDEIRKRGILTEAAFPYADAFDKPPKFTKPDDPSSYWLPHCIIGPDRDSKVYRVTKFAAFQGDKRKDFLATRGPLVCGFKVYQDFSHYDGGVYSHVSGDYRGGHAVLVIGYDDDAGCWICRNSWGTGWGGSADPDGTGAGFFQIAYGDCNIDGEPMYGAVGVIPPTPAGWGGWWRVSKGVAAAGSSVFPVSSATNHLEVFAPGTDRSIGTASWRPEVTGWQGWARVQGGSAAPNSWITAVSRRRDFIDVFAVSPEQGIGTAAYSPKRGWEGWWPIQGGSAAPGSSVFGVSRRQDRLDVFSVGKDRGVYTSAWDPTLPAWKPWTRVQGGSAAPNTSVTAVSRRPDYLDIFAVGTDQKIWTAAYSPSGGWEGWWSILGGVAAPGTTVFGVSSSLNRLDVFAVGTDRHVYTAWWTPQSVAWQGWARIGRLKAAPGSSVYAASRGEGMVDIFAVAEDGSIFTARLKPGSAWQGWFPILGGKAAPGTTVTAVSRAPGLIDVFAVGGDGKIWTAAS